METMKWIWITYDSVFQPNAFATETYLICEDRSCYWDPISSKKRVVGFAWTLYTVYIQTTHDSTGFQTKFSIGENENADKLEWKKLKISE